MADVTGVAVDIGAWRPKPTAENTDEQASPGREDKMASEVISKDAVLKDSKLDGTPSLPVARDVTPGSALLSFDPLLLVAICTFLVSNSAYLFLASAQDDIYAPAGPGREPEPFDSPALQAFFGNVSELILLPIYIISELVSKQHGSSRAWSWVEKLLKFSMDESLCHHCDASCHHCCAWGQTAPAGIVLAPGAMPPIENPDTVKHLRSSPPRPRVPFVYWAAPAALGLGADICRFSALEYLPVSLQNMLDGFIIPCLALSGWLVLRKRLLLIPHLLGAFLVLSGVIAVGISPLLLGKGLAGEHGRPIDSSAWVTGSCFTALSVICQSIQVTLHEYMMTNYDCNPLEVMSLDTLWTVIMGSVAMLGLQLAMVEDICAALYQITHSKQLSALIVAYSFSHVPAQLMTYVIVGRAGGLLMSMIFQCQTGLLWLIDIFWNGQRFQLTELAAFALVALGTLVYTYVIPIRKWTGLKPTLEDVVHAEDEDTKGRMYERYLRGDGNAWFRCCCSARRPATPELQMSSL